MINTKSLSEKLISFAEKKKEDEKGSSIASIVPSGYLCKTTKDEKKPNKKNKR